jgi:hypothetical protein
MMSPPNQTHNNFNVQRWIWVLDVLFGAIAAIALEKYEPVVRDAWSCGFIQFFISVFVAICIGSFFAYDVVVHHKLVEKFPYKVTFRGLCRFLLDLVMAFILFIILSAGFQANPSWEKILINITIWHMAAILWHLLAESTDEIKHKIFKIIGPHACVIGAYWIVTNLSNNIINYYGLNTTVWSNLPLFLLATTIMIFSYVRLKQILKM